WEITRALRRGVASGRGKRVSNRGCGPPAPRLVCVVRTRVERPRRLPMRALPSLCRPLTAALAATALLTSAASASPWALKPGEFYSEVGGEFFSARSFLRNSDSKRAPLFGAIEQRSVRSHNEIGWKKRASVWLDVPFVSRTYASDLATSGSRTSTGLGDFDLG